MKFSINFFTVFGFLILLGAGCVQTTNETATSANTSTAPTVSTNSSQTTPENNLVSETFESENGDFSYTLNWNTKVLGISETKSKWSSEKAPTFNIVGGGTVSMMTGLIDVPGLTMDKFIKNTYFNNKGDWPDSQPDPISAGTISPIYYFDQPITMSPGCLVKYAVVKGLNEALSIRLEDCTGNDMVAGQAFGDLLDDLVITRK